MAAISGSDLPAEALPVRRIGRTGLCVSILGLGGVPLGNHQHEIADDLAMDTIAAAYEFGIRYFDVAPQYGHGLAEHRFGSVLRNVDSDDLVVSTKVGRLLYPRASGRGHAGDFRNTLAFDYRYDYSFDGVMRSVEDSLQRLGLHRVNILYIHNIDSENLAGEHEAFFRQAVAGGHKALRKLREEGTVSAIGVGNNHWQVCKRFAEEVEFDVFMIASKSAYSLLVTDLLDDFLPYCLKRGISIVVGGALNSGILATGAVPGAQFAYGAPTDDVVRKVQGIERVCAKHDVPLVAAALQFPLAHPAVASVVQGARSRQQVAQSVAAISMPIPAALWSDLKSEGLLRRDAPVPDEPGLCAHSVAAGNSQ